MRVSDIEVVLGDFEQMLVLLDLLLHRGQLARGLVVLLDRQVGFVVHALQLRLDLAQPCLLVCNGRGGGLGGEGEGEEEGAEKEREDCDSSLTVHCIASFWTRRRGGHALVEVSPECVALGLPSLPQRGDTLTELKYETLTPVSYTHLRAHETRHDLVCRLLLE